MDPVVAWRVAVAVLVVVTPTLLFLGLWHGLMRMRDGELVQRVQARVEEQSATAGGAAGSPSGSPAAPVPAGRARLVRCSSCGERNFVAFDYCRECLAALPGT